MGAWLLPILPGQARDFSDEHELHGHGMLIDDALYARCREAKDECHG